ncbi:hypothetical protein Ahy_B02g060064 [Arachis hypogaea]|uniref:Uncharacterized protein n=1 Tax=Arachis hypogaea TaxID=3818 RepID=A0A445AHX6_ARAHY|nr:hypothetical protein Ahy_B02g060064 [Arachis hypogaea]
MRGRLWALWLCQTFAGVFCIILGLVGSLSVSVVVMIIFSVFVQATCGMTFGIVPFVSRRALCWDFGRWNHGYGSFLLRDLPFDIKEKGPSALLKVLLFQHMNDLVLENICDRVRKAGMMKKKKQQKEQVK